MGRPFIIYEDDACCTSEPSPSGQSAYQTYDVWSEAAQKALEESGILDDRTDSARPAISAILAYLFSRRRVAFLPNCEPAPESGLGLFESKVGGLPYLLPSESWPCNNDTGLTHLWQLRVHDLPAAVQQALGFTRGLLQVFLSDTLVEEEEGKWFLVRVLDEGQLVHRTAAEIVPGPDANLLDEQRVTSYTCSYDFPHYEDAMDGLPGGTDRRLATDMLNVLQECGLYVTVPGDKLLGWPRWCQGSDWRVTEEGQAYVQLMQVEGSVVPFQVGDSGTLLLQRHPTDRQQWDVSWACC